MLNKKQVWPNYCTTQSHDMLWCLHNKWENVEINRSARTNEEIKVLLGLICKEKKEREKKKKIQQPFLTALCNPHSVPALALFSSASPSYTRNLVNLQPIT